MKIADLIITGNHIDALNIECVPAGTVGATVSLQFDEAWNGLTKTAVFIADGLKRDVYLVEAEAVVPAEILQRPGVEVFVGVYGKDGTGALRMPTNWVSLYRVLGGAVPGCVPDLPPYPGWTDQVETAIEENRDNLAAHVADQSNPHGVTAKQAGAIPTPEGGDIGDVLTKTESGWEPQKPSGGVSKGYVDTQDAATLAAAKKYTDDHSGTNDHASLINRDKANQHPIEAITGLAEALAGKQPSGNYANAEDVPTNAAALPAAVPAGLPEETEKNTQAVLDALGDKFQLFEENKADRSIYLLDNSTVTQADARDVLTYADQYTGLIEFISTSESKVAAVGYVLSNLDGTCLVTIAPDGTATQWSKESFAKLAMEARSLVNEGTVDTDNLTVDVAGNPPVMYFLRGAMNKPGGSGPDGSMLVVPHSISKQIFVYMDMDSGKLWTKTVTGTADHHAFGTWQAMGGSTTPGKSIAWGQLTDPASASDTHATVASIIQKHTRIVAAVKNPKDFRNGDLALLPGQYNDAPRQHYTMIYEVEVVRGSNLEGYALSVIEEGLPGKDGAPGKDAFYPVQEETASTLELAPNIYHKWGEMASLTITLGAETPGIVNDFCGRFTSGTQPTTFSVPESVKWPSPLKVEANKTYEFSIVENLGVIVGA